MLVVSGEGRSFSSGLDLSTLGSISGTPEDMIARAQEGFRRLAALPIPSIAAVKGHALGAGLQLALACDLRVATSDSRLGLLEMTYGMIPDLGGSTILPRLVGPALAKKMIWLAETLSGEEASRIGLVDVLTAPEELDDSVGRLAKQIADAAPTPLREAKALIDRAHVRDTEAGMDAEAAAQERCLTSSDFAAAITRAMQRRDARSGS